MNKLFLLSTLLIITPVQAATVNLLCPDGTPMRQGTSCAPEAGCHPTGVIIKANGKQVSKNIDGNGSINLDNVLIGESVTIKSGDNFWSPSYCKHLSGPGYLASTFTLKENQTIHMAFYPFINSK